MWDTVFTRSGGGTAPGKIYLIMTLCLVLSACVFDSGDNTRVSLAPPPPAFIPSDVASDQAPKGTTIRLSSALRISENDALKTLTTDPPVPEGCGIKDRFDRSSFLSFSSEDGKRKLALNLDTGGMNIDGVELRYTMKLGKTATKTKKERCLYPAQVQGLAPSAYRELIKRKSDTVWQRVKALKNDFLE